MKTLNEIITDQNRINSDEELVMTYNEAKELGYVDFDDYFELANIVEDQTNYTLTLVDDLSDELKV